jgi:hypothetical protein
LLAESKLEILKLPVYLSDEGFLIPSIEKAIDFKFEGNAFDITILLRIFYIEHDI